MIRMYDARQALAPYIEGGVNPASPRALEGINLAWERLMTSEPELHTCQARLVGYDGHITLPRELRSIHRARIEGAAMQPRSMWWEFGSRKHLTERFAPLSITSGLMDRGYSPTKYDIADTPAWLMAFSENEADEGVQLVVTGIDETGRDIYQDNQRGVRLVIRKGSGSVEVKTRFSKVTGVVKPPTAGHINLYAVRPEDGEIYPLSIYHPDERIPSYRRYAYRAGIAASETVLAVCALNPIRYTNDDDLIPCPSLSALKAMCQAISAEDADNIDTASKHEARAIRVLRMRLADEAEEAEIEVSETKGMDHAFHV